MQQIINHAEILKDRFPMTMEEIKGHEMWIALIAVPVILFLYRYFIFNRESLHSKVGQDERRYIFVTGAGSGIGLATANLFAEKGWVVGYYDVRVNTVKEAVEKRTSQSGIKKGLYGHIDVTDASSCEAALKDFLHNANTDHLDCLFNSAGVLTIGEFDEFPLQRQLEQLEVNIGGVVKLIYSSLPYLKKSKLGGRIVTMASIQALGGFPLHSVYSASKAAVYALTESLNMELYSKYNITCCDVATWYVATPMVYGQNRFDTISLSFESLYRSPETVAKIVFYAVHHCRRHREHFYDTPNWMIFKFAYFCRAFGSRAFNMTSHFLHFPKNGWNSMSAAKHESEKDRKKLHG